MGILTWIRGAPPIIIPVSAKITKQDRDSEITPNRSLDDLDLRALQIGYCVIQRLPELLKVIEIEIQKAKDECVKTWR